MIMNELSKMYLGQVDVAINRLCATNSKQAESVIKGHMWYVLDATPLRGFYNTTPAEAFEASGVFTFRWIYSAEGIPNPYLCLLKKTKKRGIYAFEFAVMASDNGIVGSTDKYMIREAAIKQKCKDIFERDGGYKDSSSEEYRRAVHSCVICLNSRRRTCEGANDIKEALVAGIMYMFDAVNSVSVATDFDGGWLLFPVEEPQLLNEIFKHRDREDGQKHKSIVYSEVKGHTRKNGAEVDSHIRTKGFTYKNREFGLILGGDSVFKKWDVRKSEKAGKRFNQYFEKHPDERLDGLAYHDDATIYR